jgi:putative transposase
MHFAKRNRERLSLKSSESSGFGTEFRGKKLYAGLGISELRRLKSLEEENRKLKALVADLFLDKQILKDVQAKKV